MALLSANQGVEIQRLGELVGGVELVQPGPQVGLERMRIVAQHHRVGERCGEQVPNDAVGVPDVLDEIVARLQAEPSRPKEVSVLFRNRVRAAAGPAPLAQARADLLASVAG